MIQIERNRDSNFSMVFLKTTLISSTHKLADKGFHTTRLQINESI